MQPIQMTKAEYMALPANQRRRWKDGTYVVLVHRGNAKSWEPVVWTR